MRLMRLSDLKAGSGVKQTLPLPVTSPFPIEMTVVCGCRPGKTLVVTAGVPVGVPGTTNMIKVHMVGDSLLAGVGIGSRNAKGEVCVCRSAAEAAKKFKPGQILVVPFTTNDELPFIREAAGVITEEAGANSHSAIVGLTLNKAVIVGATNATRTLKDGMVISMDCIRGTVQLMAN